MDSSQVMDIRREEAVLLPMDTDLRMDTDKAMAMDRATDSTTITVHLMAIRRPTTITRSRTIAISLTSLELHSTMVTS